MDGDAVVFHVKPNENRAGIVPKDLQEIMVDEDVLLAGVTVGHDLTLIRDCYHVEGAEMVDLGQLATRHLGIAIGPRSLDKLSATLLRPRLSKANSVRMDNWEKELSPAQVNTRLPKTRLLSPRFRGGWKSTTCAA